MGGSIPSRHFGYTFSFSSSSHSRAALYSHWMVGSLSRASLRDFGSPGQVDRAFDVGSFFASSPRVTPLSLFLSSSQSLPASSCSLLQVSSRSRLQSTLPQYAVPTFRQSGTRSRSPFLSLKSVARAPGLSKTPLVRMRPRGYTPHGYGGVDGGLSRMTGASDGSVRTRLCPFLQFVPVVR